MLQSCDSVEREQEAVWVCQATGQESQDKGKETQMEVLELKLSYIPKASEDKHSLTGVIKV